MTKETKVPEIKLGLMVITLYDQKLFKTREDAEILAKATGNRLEKYDQKNEDGVTQAILQDPHTIITLPGARERRHGSTEFIIISNDSHDSPQRELEWTASLLSQAIKLHRERNPDPDSTQETLLRTVHIINTQEMPEGVPEEQTETPVARRFLTPSGNRCLSTAT